MTPQYSFELVQTRDTYLAYLRLRRATFCDEQGLFKTTDEDDWDASAFPIAAVLRGAPGGEAVVGTVRIYEAEPGLWYGGRLAVERAHRKQGVVGRGLVHKAVTTAHGWGCQRFLALVQAANVPFFESIHWRSLEERSFRDRPHHLMEADLASYPPSDEPRPPPGQRFR
ncbi:MSMEG_0567/Sll0786 family nitrogen starvation N-acetyltransferase [Sorangium cellulosum]|uniref:MSMEG_0567/Sll0786 family nitrogen starvation N-acetyltransferase n=1 Tax=Sorangium sp. So ce385 TaxID=3133308 RepID=UPI001019F7DE